MAHHKNNQTAKNLHYFSIFVIFRFCYKLTMAKHSYRNHSTFTHVQSSLIIFKYVELRNPLVQPCTCLWNSLFTHINTNGVDGRGGVAHTLNGRWPQIFLNRRWPQMFLKMEDNLAIFLNGIRPQIFGSHFS